MNATTPGPLPALARCRCGHDKTHANVRPVKRYGWLGHMALLMGYTSRPVRIAWVCSTCGTEVGAITDPGTLERFRYDEPHRGKL